MWLCGPSSRICLPNPSVPQEPDVRRHQDHDEREREQQPLDQLERSRRRLRAAERRDERVDERSSSMPRDALTSTDVARRGRSRRVDRAASRSRRLDDPRRGAEARRQRAIDDPGAAPPAAPSTTTSDVEGLAAASPTSRWPASCASPSSRISPRTAIRGGREPGQQLQRGAAPTPVTAL